MLRGWCEIPTSLKRLVTVVRGCFAPCSSTKLKEQEIYIKVNRFFPSSKTCYFCLNQVSSLPLEVRNWTCEVCNTEHDRDVNAAINIRHEALRILELGTRSTAFGRERKSSGKTSVLLDAVPVEQGSRLSIA